MRHTLLVASLVLSLVACLSPSRGKVATTDAAADAAAPTDTAPATDTLTADAVETCPPRVLVPDQGAAADPRSPWRVATADADRVYLTGEPFGAPSRLLAFSPATGVTTAVTPEGDRVELLDAAAGVALFASVGADGDTSVVFLRANGEAVALTQPGGGERVWLGSPYPLEQPRMVGPERAAWYGCGEARGWSCTRAAIRGWLGGDVRTLWSSPTNTAAVIAPPDVDGAGIVWAEPGAAAGTSRLGAWDVGREPRTLRTWDGVVTRVVRAGAALVWIDARGVWRAAGEAGEATLLTAGTCAALTADGARVAYLCEPAAADPPARPWTPLPAGRGALWVHDGAALRAVPTEGAVLALPRLTGDALLWLAYPDEDAGCTAIGPGAVWAAPIARPEASVAVASLGIGCYCCAMIWPDLQLSAADGLVAWSYAEVTARPVDRQFGRLGWARVRVTTSCE